MVFCENSKFPVISAGKEGCRVWSEGPWNPPPSGSEYVLALRTEEDRYLQLKQLADRLGPKLLVPVCWRQLLPEAGLLISAQLSGGTLQERLTEAAQAAPGRCWLYLESMSHFLPLPCPDGQPEPISVEPERFAKTFFSEDFCCRYAHSLTPPGLFLFDTPETMQRKLQLAQYAGLIGAILPP